MPKLTRARIGTGCDHNRFGDKDFRDGAQEQEAAARIADPGELVVVSAASIWEAAIKQSIGKLVAPEALGQAALDEGFEPLPVTFVHAARAGGLPRHHRDPFDRMLVAQAQLEELTIATRDPVFDQYEVPVLRC